MVDPLGCLVLSCYGGAGVGANRVSSHCRASIDRRDLTCHRKEGHMVTSIFTTVIPVHLCIASQLCNARNAS